MKKIWLLFAVLSLTGCSFIMPRPHDPVMFGNLVDVKISLSKTDCSNKDWSQLMAQVERGKVYSTLREDPQADAFVKLEEALDKANKSKSEAFCKNVLKVNTTRVDVIIDAWKGR